VPHDFSPFLFQFTETFGIRYYSLGYLFGVLLTYIWLVKVAGYDKEKVADFVLGAFVAIVVGGRLGEVFFYEPQWIWTDFWRIFRIWEGGMSFHGGFLLVTVWIWYYVKKQKWSFLKIGDALVAPAILGIALTKVGNFMNGELFGRPTDVSWCYIFPKADDLCRHPSQLYQALGNVLVSIMLAWAYFKKFRTGTVAALFLIGYGVVRTTVEIFWREPDWMYMGISSGTWLSVPMIIAGLIMLWRIHKTEI
jgi:phosphatidylglycerol:prolipoprotein diacylglycerol transferase